MATSWDSITINAIDLLALACCIGILSFRAFVVPPRNLPRQASQTALAQLWKLLGICLALLTISSAGWLVHRTIVSSGQPIGELAKVLPTMLWQTHFGHVWLIRPVALLVLWLGWRQARRHCNTKLIWAMLMASSAIAASRSLSGHAADWGDITLPEIVD